MARKRGGSAPPAPRPNLLVSTVGAFLLVWALVAAWRGSSTYAGVDFAQLWGGGKTARVSGAAIYGPDGVTRTDAFLRSAYETQKSTSLLQVIDARSELAGEEGHEWLAAQTGSPLMYAAFGLFPADYDAAYLLWRIASLLAAAAALVMFTRIGGLSWGVALIVAAAVISLYEPIASEHRVANTGEVQIAVLAAYLVLAMRDDWRAVAAGGALVALLTLFKPNLIFVWPLVALVRIARRDLRSLRAEMLGVGIGGLAGLTAGALWFGGADAWSAWAAVARRLGAERLSADVGNVAFFDAPAVIALVLIAVFATAIFRGRERPANSSLPITAAAGALVFLIASRLVWLHYLVLALPAAVLLLGFARGWLVRIAAVLALSFISVNPWIPIFQLHTHVGESRLIVLGLALLFVLAVMAVGGRPSGRVVRS